MWPRLVLPGCLCLLLVMPPDSLAAETCHPKGKAIQPTRIQIHEAKLVDALKRFNDIGSNISADDIPKALNQTATLYQGRFSYFDTPDLQLLRSGKALLFHEKIRHNKQTPVDITLQLPGGKKSRFEAKNYRRKLTALDKHPLLGHIKRSERKPFLATLTTHGIATPLTLKPVLILDFNRKNFVIRKYTTPVLQIGFSAIETSAFGMGLYIYEFEIKPTGCQENLSLNPMEQNFIDDLAGRFEQQVLTQQIGSITTDRHYQRYWQAAREAFPLLDLTTRYPLLIALSQALILALIGGLLLWLILSRHATKGKQ